MVRLSFSAAEKCSYFTETKPNRRFALAVGSDVRDGCAGVSLGYGERAVQNRTGGHDAQFTVHRQQTG